MGITNKVPSTSLEDPLAVRQNFHSFPHDYPIPIPPPAPHGTINSKADAVAAWRSKTGGQYLAGPQVITDIKQSNGWKHNDEKIVGLRQNELHKVPCNQTSGKIHVKGKTVGIFWVDDIVGSVDVNIDDYDLDWKVEATKELGTTISRRITGRAIRKCSFNDLYDFQFEITNPLTFITDTLPSLYAGDGVKFWDKGEFEAEIKATVIQCCPK